MIDIVNNSMINDERKITGDEDSALKNEQDSSVKC